MFPSPTKPTFLQHGIPVSVQQAVTLHCLGYSQKCTFIQGPWSTLIQTTLWKTSVHKQFSTISCVKKNNKNTQKLSNSSVHLEAIQRYHTDLRGESGRNYVGRSECSRQSVQPHVSFLKTCSAPVRRKHEAFTSWYAWNSILFSLCQKASY